MSRPSDHVAYLLSLSDERLVAWAHEAKRLAALHGDVGAGAIAALRAVADCEPRNDSELQP